MKELFQSLGLEAYAADPQVRNLAMSYLELYRSSPEPQVSVDAKTRCVLFVNDALCDMTGYTREEMVGTPILMFIHPDNRGISKNAFARLEEEHSIRDVHLDFAHKSGRRIRTSVSSNGMVNDAGIMLRSNSVIRLLDSPKNSTSHEDISTLEHELKASQKKAEQLEETTYHVAHDLREPVRNVQALSRMIRTASESSNPTRMNDYMDHLDKTAGRLSDMVSGLFEMSTDGSKSEAETINLNDVCQHVQEDLSVLFLETNAVIIIEPIPTLRGYRLELRSLFQNLIENAIKFKHSARLPEIHISVKSNDETLRIFVRDNGRGIQADHVPHVFDPFYRLPEDQHKPGAGIGLARCRKIMHLHNGSIQLASKPGIGTTLELVFPLNQPAG